MAVRPAIRCPHCGSTTFHEIGRIESGEFRLGAPPEDVAIYECEGDACGSEFSSDEEGAR